METTQTESSDIPESIDLLPIHNTEYGLGKYKYGVIRHMETRLKLPETMND